MFPLCFVDDLYEVTACQEDDSAIITRANRTLEECHEDCLRTTTNCRLQYQYITHYPLNAKLSDRNFQPLAASCVSLPRLTTSSGQRLLLFL